MLGANGKFQFFDIVNVLFAIKRADLAGVVRHGACLPPDYKGSHKESGRIIDESHNACCTCDPVKQHYEKRERNSNT